MMISEKPHVLLMGQTPPPWHGQAVATKILFDHDWPGWNVHRLRMEFSGEMLEVGRFQWKKMVHLWRLMRQARGILRRHPGTILFYPPASAKWVPFLRDVIFLACVRPLAGATVFIYHASGLPVFANAGALRKKLATKVYGQADVSLEVAMERLPPHEVFAARSSRWCPCAIEVPEMPRVVKSASSRRVILFVGSLQEGKGVLEILKTAAQLKEHGQDHKFHFRIVGKWFSQEFETEARQLHTDLGLAESVEFVGQLTGDEKWRAYADADVFFFPTHYESEATPIVIMEALGMGLPVVSTHWAGIPAMLEGCATAELRPVKSPAEFANALESFSHATPAAVEELSREFYRKNFLPERFIGRVDQAFREALESSDLITGKKRRICTYLADQNPGYDRSFGISRMSQIVLEALLESGRVHITSIVSETSQQPPSGAGVKRTIPWNTRRKWVRLITDHCFPLFIREKNPPDLHYFPKGYLPLLSRLCRPNVVTIHDTIIQYDEDRYPGWRTKWEYAYWSWMLRHTLREADAILTVSHSSKQQIEAFMKRHSIPLKEITVTFEPCVYEKTAQPLAPVKENYVIHLASVEPHKRTTHLVNWWHEEEKAGRNLPTLHLIGTVPEEVMGLISQSHSIVKRPFLSEEALMTAYLGARALILPSEIEGFGLPALEAYYLGTPVCFVKGTSVDEILGVATHKGGFVLDDTASLRKALEEALAMTPEEIHSCGLKLRETYAAKRVAERMLRVFDGIKGR